MTDLSEHIEFTKKHYPEYIFSRSDKYEHKIGYIFINNFYEEIFVVRISGRFYVVTKVPTIN